LFWALPDFRRLFLLGSSPVERENPDRGSEL